MYGVDVFGFCRVGTTEWASRYASKWYEAKSVEVKAKQKSEVEKKLDTIEKLLVQTQNCAKIQRLARHNPVGKRLSNFHKLIHSWTLKYTHSQLYDINIGSFKVMSPS